MPWPVTLVVAVGRKGTPLQTTRFRKEFGKVYPLIFPSRLVQCIKRSVSRRNPLGRVTPGPLESFGRLVVVGDVAEQFAAEVWDGSEHPSSDQVTLDFGKPKLNLIELRRVSGRVMKLHLPRMG